MGNAAADQLGIVGSSPLLSALIDDLATAGGLDFVYRCLSRLREHWHLRDVLAVIDHPAVGRQVFKADRRPLDPGWQRDVALRSTAGIYTEPALVDVTDDLTNAYNLCAIAFRSDWLQYQSMHDALTGLYNRRGFDEQLEQAVGRSRRYDWGFSLVLIDLDEFKDINDRLGHPGGDAVLRAVGDRLRQNLRAGDVAGRVGGDEFALLLPSGGAEVIPSLLERLHIEVDVEGEAPADIALSVGVAACPEDATSVETLYQLADQRLYESKRR